MPARDAGSAELVRLLANGAELLKETHISWVALTPDHAFKVKKPVSFGFLDYGTLEKRRYACEEELRLGRRLAPGVYLECRPITRGPQGQLVLGASDGGEIVEHCVVMRRLPEERMLDRLIARGAATVGDIERLLDVLVPFYAHGPRGPELDRFATAAAIERQVRDNLAAIEAHLPHASLGCQRASQLQLLHASAELFTGRIRAGRVCEGHGDLRAEHVCMTSPPTVFDCVEFSIALRAADVASELAFLAMDCDFLDVPELGQALIRGYRARSGDELPGRLVTFYEAHHACVRAKVELLRADQQAEGDATRSRERAQRYLQLARDYAPSFYRPTLFVMVGASGTGKSTVADALAATLGLEALRTDAIRHRLAGRREPDAGRGEGIYAGAVSDATYAALFDAAVPRLGDAGSVVLDGTFRDPGQRERAADLARDWGARVLFVVCQCPPDVARCRIAERIARGATASDARPALLDSQLGELQAAGDWQRLPAVVLDTTRPVEISVARVISTIREL